MRNTNCIGCTKLNEYGDCTVYPNADAKWIFGRCPFAPCVQATKAEKKLNPIKASKRGV